jgi:hypothetical protein
MLSGYWLIKMLDDYMNYGKPPEETSSKPILNDVIVEPTLTNGNSYNKVTIPSTYINTSLQEPNKQESYQQEPNSNYQRTLHLLNKYLFNDSMIIDL